MGNPGTQVASLVFATSNQHKMHELRAQLGTDYDFRSLADINCTVDIPESSDTLRGNALQKARYVVDHFGVDCFAEDTGLEVAALDDRPGVLTARYAGAQRSDVDNMRKVLAELVGEADRSARFRTVIALSRGGREWLFEGEVRGQIAAEPRGSEGFGYDPIFVPEGYDVTFAQLPLSVKKTISHRARAVQRFVAHLRNSLT